MTSETNYQHNIDKIRINLKENADIFTDIVIIDTSKISQDLGIDSSKIVRSLRDLEKISGEIRREFNSRGFVKSVVLLPKFFENLRKKGIRTEANEKSIPVIKPLLIGKRIRPPVEHYLPEMQNEIIRQSVSEDLYREIFASFYVIGKFFNEMPDTDFDFFSNMLKNLSSKSFHNRD